MPILTSEKYMELLDIDDQALVPIIKANIITFQNWITAHLKNYFHTDDDILAATISFSGQVISDADSNFVSAGFLDDMDIHIEGSKRNDGIYRIGSVAAGTLTLDANFHSEDFATEAAANSIYITGMSWPVGIEFPTAKAIQINIGQTSGQVEATKASFDDIGRLPQGILDKFKPWQKWGLLAKNLPERIRT